MCMLKPNKNHILVRKVLINQKMDFISYFLRLSLNEMYINYYATLSVINKIHYSEYCFDTCENPPSNLDDTLIDASFSRWMPYLCKKEGEEPYLLEEVFVMSLNSADRKNPELVKGPLTFYTPEVLMMELSMSMSNIKRKRIYTELIQNKLKSKSSNSSNMVTNDESDDIYKSYYVDNNNIINPYQIVEEEEIKLITNLCDCLSVERACEYGKWLDVGLALHNTNPDKFLPVWEKFSEKYSRYKNGNSKRSCSKKWESFKNSSTNNPLTVGSIRYWANNDDPEKYNRVMTDSLGSQIEKSIDKGPEAHHLIGLVIHKYYQDQFLCVDIADDWYYFNGVRWKKTLKANELKRRSTTTFTIFIMNTLKSIKT